MSKLLPFLSQTGCGDWVEPFLRNLARYRMACCGSKGMCREIVISSHLTWGLLSYFCCHSKTFVNSLMYLKIMIRCKDCRYWILGKWKKVFLCGFRLWSFNTLQSQHKKRMLLYLKFFRDNSQKNRTAGYNLIICISWTLTDSMNYDKPRFL